MSHIYLPQRFRNRNSELSFQLMSENPLATMISIVDGEPFVSHIPLIVEQDADEIVLVGHLARANPHWKSMSEQKIYVIFNGPNEYMSPSWYANNDVPTWSYAVVHIEGHCSLIEDLNGILDCLKKLSTFAEAKFKNPWQFWIPEDLAAPGIIEKSIVGFKIKVTSLNAKFKLNQSRSEADLHGVTKGLEAKNTDSARKIAELMNTAWHEHNAGKLRK